MFRFARSSTPRHVRVRTVALATAGSCFLAMLAALQAPSATAAGSDVAPASESTVESYDETSVAARKAAETGERVEVESRRGADTTTFVNPDGTTTVEVTHGDTRVKQDGEWVEIDPSLQKENGVLVPEASKADVEITDGSGSEPLASIDRGSKSLSLDWSTDLPPARVDGAEATFDAGADRDVRVTATDAGFNVHIVLDEIPTTAPVYRLPVKAKGLRLTERVGGGFAANDSTGKAVFAIAPPKMWDATQEGLEAGPEVTEPVAAELLNDSSGGQVLELRPSMAWLSDPARVTPIVIDPDVYDVRASSDTFVSSAQPNTGMSSERMTRVGVHSSNGKNRGFIIPRLPARVGGTVLSATLKLWQYDAGSCTPSPINVYPTTSHWTSDQLTWTSATRTVDPLPSYTTNASYAATASFANGREGSGGCPNGPGTIDVTKMVRAWMNYVPDDPFTPANEQVGLPSYGMTLMASETNTSHYKSFCSLNPDLGDSATYCNTHDRKPRVAITYNTPPTKAFDTQQSPVTCYDGDVPRLTSLTPTLKATADDVDVWHQNPGDSAPTDDGQENVRLKFEVWPQRAVDIADLDNQDPNDPEGPVVMTASGHSPYVQRNTATQWTVPAGVLVDNTEYVWRAIADDGNAVSPYWSDWMVFRTNTAEAPGVNCPQRVLDNTTAEAAATALDAVVETNPGEYANATYDAATGAVLLQAVQTGGRTVEETQARAADQAAAHLNNTSTLSTEEARESLAALRISVVNNSRTQLTSTLDDISARAEADDPTLPEILELSLDYGLNRVRVGLTEMNDANVNAIHASYGSTVVVEQGRSGIELTEGPFDDFAGNRNGGVHIARNPFDPSSACSSSTPMSANGRTYLLTAGHCVDGLNQTVFTCSRDMGFCSNIGRVVGYANDATMDAAVIESDDIDFNAISWTGERLPNEAAGNVFGSKPRRVGMSATKDPMFGQVCKWGITTGHRCGYTIRQTDFRYQIKGGKLRRGLVFAEDNKSGYGIGGGDSGGLVYTVIQNGARAGQIQVMGVITAGLITNSQQKLGDDFTYYPIRVVNGRFAPLKPRVTTVIP